MLRRFLGYTAILLSGLAGPGVAQEAVFLPSGTEVRLETTTPLSSKTSVKGDLVQLRTAEEVRAGDRVVIPKGTPAVGQIADARAKGGLGMSGKLAVRPLFLKLGDRTIRLGGQVSDKGGVAAEAVVGMVVLTPVLSGRSAELPVGTPVVGRVERTVLVEP